MPKYSSLKSFKLYKSVDKRYLWNSVNRKLNYTIHSSHVFAVLNFLIDEIITDLLKGNEINIPNFGILKLKKMPSRKYHDLTKNLILMSKGNTILRFILKRKISKLLSKNIDIEGMFEDK